MGRQDGPAGKGLVDLSVLPVTRGKVGGEQWLPCPKLSLGLYTSWGHFRRGVLN